MQQQIKLNDSGDSLGLSTQDEPVAIAIIFFLAFYSFISYTFWPNC